MRSIILILIILLPLKSNSQEQVLAKFKITVSDQSGNIIPNCVINYAIPGRPNSRSIRADEAGIAILEILMNSEILTFHISFQNGNVAEYRFKSDDETDFSEVIFISLISMPLHQALEERKRHLEDK